MAWQKRRGATEELSADPAKARESALAYLAGREYASGELYEKLKQRYTEQAAAQSIAEMIELGYLNDSRYAEVYANSLYHAHKSRRAAQQKLRQKGLGQEELENALNAVYQSTEDGENPEEAAAYALVQGQYRRRLQEGRKDLVVAALARRGFAYPVIRTAIERVQTEEY